MDYSRVTINENSSIIDALNIIENGSYQIALVINETNRLVGILSDGDVRRALIKGNNLESKVNKIMNKNFHSAINTNDKNELLNHMKLKGIRHLPVINKEGILKDLILLEDLTTPRKVTNPVIIMAGGKGKRLRPYTETCPKPMLEVNGKPMLEIVLENFISNGFTNFYISVNYKKEQILDYFGDGSKFGVSINYLIEDKPLGTAGSLKLLPKDINESFIVINGDVLTRLNPLNILRFHNDNNATATIGSREYAITIPFGVINSIGAELKSFEEKPSYSFLVNTGVYVLNPSALSLIKTDSFLDMPCLLERIKKEKNKVVICPIFEYWIDVGRPETFDQAHKEWDFN